MLFRKPGRGKFEIRSQSDGEVEILIYDIIGEDFWGEGVSAKSVVQQLSEITADTIHVRINSPGGDAFDGFAIYNALRRHPAAIETHIDGLAASSAATVALAGDRIKMAENAFLMIHRSWGIVLGDADEMMEMARQLEKLDTSIARIYANRTKKTLQEVLELMKVETWFDSDEALAEGFVDEITEKSGVENHFDLSSFSNVPENLRTIKKKEPEGATLRDEFESMEAALTAAGGFSDRVRSLTDLRGQQGRRPLSKENRGRLEETFSRLTGIENEIEVLLREKAPESEEVVASLLAQFVKTQFELNHLLRA
ncbi:Clp protease ClpP [Acidobacteria bacterium AH-259-A15]|nr:Clp protease ClpP [Acidobacteria bacterium AH-259-A15]